MKNVCRMTWIEPMERRFSSTLIGKSLLLVTRRKDKAMSELVADRGSDLTALERKRLERLADSDSPAAELAAAYLKVYDEYRRE